MADSEWVLFAPGSSTGWLHVHRAGSGERLTSIALHSAVAGLRISEDAARIAVRSALSTGVAQGRRWSTLTLAVVRLIAAFAPLGRKCTQSGRVKTKHLMKSV